MAWNEQGTDVPQTSVPLSGVPGGLLIEFEPTALKELKKLGREPARQIVRTLEQRIASLDDPRSLGAPLTGQWRGYWRWRMGDYRVVARIEDERVLILMVRVAHRREF